MNTGRKAQWQQLRYNSGMAFYINKYLTWFLSLPSAPQMTETNFLLFLKIEIKGSDGSRVTPDPFS